MRGSRITDRTSISEFLGTTQGQTLQVYILVYQQLLTLVHQLLQKTVKNLTRDQPPNFGVGRFRNSLSHIALVCTAYMLYPQTLITKHP